MDATHTATVGRMLRRHWWLLFVGVIVGATGGGLTLDLTRPCFAAFTSVLVLPIGSADVNLQTEAQLARSTQTASDAATLLAHDSPVPVERTEAAQAEVDPVPGTSVLLIRYEASTPQAAQLGARAFAQAYLANRTTAAESTLDKQLAALTERISSYDAQVADLSARSLRLPATSPELPRLRTTISTLTAQISAMTTTANELAATTVNPGRVVKEPDLPMQPTRPSGWLYLACGALSGVLLGCVAALARERLSRRVSNGAAVIRRDKVPLLAELATSGVGARAGVLSAKDPGGRLFNRLRNEVVASLRDGEQVILVTGASPGVGSTVVAANLAAALARADNAVILVGANAAEFGAQPVTLSHIFDVADIPGLTDVLTGRAQLSRALQRAARSPRLRIVTPGGTASAAGLLQSESVRCALHELRGQARYVVVEAPSAASGADAQSLAGAADVAILVVETGRARHAQVADAAIQLRLVGTRLLGAIVLPRVVAGEPDEPLRGVFCHRAAAGFSGDGPPEPAGEQRPRESVSLPDPRQDVRRGIDEPTTVLELLRQQTEVPAETSAQVQN
jgi:Mrp family chromosome partitioning ATPase